MLVTLLTRLLVAHLVRVLGLVLRFVGCSDSSNFLSLLGYLHGLYLHGLFHWLHAQLDYYNHHYQYYHYYNQHHHHYYYFYYYYYYYCTPSGRREAPLGGTCSWPAASICSRNRSGESWQQTIKLPHRWPRVELAVAD